MTQISLSNPSSLTTQSEVKFLFDSLSKKDSITPKMSVTLNQINTLQHSGLIPSKEALLIKNNLNHPKDIQFAEGILSELILKLVEDGKLAPEMKSSIATYGLEKTIFLLYTCHLEQTYSTLEPYIIQQQVWKVWKQRPQELFIRMLEAEEMESKKYVNKWLSSLDPLEEESKAALKELLKPLTDSEFKNQFLLFLETLSNEKKTLIQRFCLSEVIDLLKNQPEICFHLALSRIIKSFSFYQKHLESIDKKNLNAHQFSLCIASDSIKNAPYAKELATSYNLMYGQIKKKWEALLPLSQKSITIIEGKSPDEKAISTTIQRLFKKMKKPFQIISPENDLKTLIGSLLKKTPELLLGIVSPQHQDLLISASKELNIPIAFLPTHTEMNEWEGVVEDPYAHSTVAFPTPIHSNFQDLINSEKMKMVGIPGLFQNKQTKEELRKKWGFDLNRKIVLINSPEGDSPWPSFLAKTYNSLKDMTILVVTDPKNTDFIHKIKTTVAPYTNLPLKILTGPNDLEREELLTLSDLVISKEDQKSSSLLFEVWNAKSHLLLDHSTKGGFLGFFESAIRFFKGESIETEIHEKLLIDENIGLMIRSKDNFKLAFEELLYQKNIISQPPHLEDRLPSLLEDLKNGVKSCASKEKKPSQALLEPFILN